MLRDGPGQTSTVHPAGPDYVSTWAAARVHGRRRPLIPTRSLSGVLDGALLGGGEVKRPPRKSQSRVIRSRRRGRLCSCAATSASLGRTLDGVQARSGSTSRSLDECTLPLRPLLHPALVERTPAGSSAARPGSGTRRRACAVLDRAGRVTRLRASRRPSSRPRPRAAGRRRSGRRTKRRCAMAALGARPVAPYSPRHSLDRGRGRHLDAWPPASTIHALRPPLARTAPPLVPSGGGFRLDLPSPGSRHLKRSDPLSSAPPACASTPAATCTPRPGGRATGARLLLHNLTFRRSDSRHPRGDSGRVLDAIASVLWPVVAVRMTLPARSDAYDRPSRALRGSPNSAQEGVESDHSPDHHCSRPSA